ncbi:phosphatases II [Obba rivulosa]|uniref:Phosphatases II n=1 Tax=Obba rivulosa TaxID=1052685 RepID=A0A8E2DN03_9APHY|nr:phosphatases II [Obba rivulosa]
MSVTLVEVFPRLLGTDDMKCAAQDIVRDDTLIAQLVPLASQHHTSEYNRLKFGPAGAPVAYVPYSVQIPDQVKAWQVYQAKCALQQAWWHCKSSAASASGVGPNVIRPAHSNNPPTSSKRRCLNRSRNSADIQDDLAAAISSPVEPLQCTEPPGDADADLSTPNPKTSESHPLNLSPMIPCLHIHAISVRLVPADERSPVMFKLPSTHHLSQIFSDPPPLETISIPLSDGIHDLATIPISASHLRSLDNSQKPAKLGSFSWANPAFRRAFHIPSGSKSVKFVKRNLSLPSWTAEIRGPRPSPSEPLSRPARSSKNLESGRCDPSRPLEKADANDSGARLRHFADANTRHSFTVFRSTSPIPDLPKRPAPTHRRTLGNIFLSSCPGNKVRLDGPVKGRAAICRDLRQDLERIRDFGVQCIVCCLDDPELEFLGVSWVEYSSIADSLGMDILRLPIPEFLAPTCVRTFDAQLARLIQSYTLRGAPVLVHCRGGIGRAGLVACCMMLRLGLCGWLEDTGDMSEHSDHEDFAGLRSPEDHPDGVPSAYIPNDDPGHCVSLRIKRNPSTNTTTSANSDVDPAAIQPDAGMKTELCATPSLAVRPDTLRLLERVISVVRARRSPKAIETYEQVKFLVEYVELLHSKGHLPSPSTP